MATRIKTVKAWAQIRPDGEIRMSTIGPSPRWLPALSEADKKAGWTIRRIKITGA
jgi:hypothetical protein